MKAPPVLISFGLLAFPFAASLADEEALPGYVVENAASAPSPLVAWSGDPAEGRVIFQAAGCADCHAAPGFEGAPNIGPDLSDVAARLTEGEIRMMIIDPSIPLGETDMPAYYAVGVFGQAPDDLVGRTRLSAPEIEALVAWLARETAQ